MTPYERQSLINDIATRAGTARELAAKHHMDVTDLRSFAETHMPAIEAAKRRLEAPEETTEAPDIVTPKQLDDLWITNKFQRLKRLQAVADYTEKMITDGAMTPAELATAVREFRSYLMLAANELGQLLNRGAGDTSTEGLSIDIAGVDMDNLR